MDDGCIIYVRDRFFYNMIFISVDIIFLKGYYFNVFVCFIFFKGNDIFFFFLFKWNYVVVISIFYVCWFRVCLFICINWRSFIWFVCYKDLIYLIYG